MIRAERMQQGHPSNQGAIALYISLIALMVLVSSALVFVSVLVGQVRKTEEVTSTERAFYAANSGVERALFFLAKRPGDSVEGQSGSLDYGGQVADYVITKASLIELEDRSLPCVRSEGSFQGIARRLFIGPGQACQ